MKCGWPESETKQSLQVCGWAAKPQNQLGWKRPLISSRPALNPALPSTKPGLWEPQLYVLNPSRDGDSSTLLGSCSSLAWGNPQHQTWHMWECLPCELTQLLHGLWMETLLLPRSRGLSLVQPLQMNSLEMCLHFSFKTGRTSERF